MTNRNDRKTLTLFKAKFYFNVTFFIPAAVVELPNGKLPRFHTLEGPKLRLSKRKKNKTGECGVLVCSDIYHNYIFYSCWL